MCYNIVTYGKNTLHSLFVAVFCTCISGTDYTYGCDGYHRLSIGGRENLRYVLEKHKGFLHKMIYEINRPLWNWNEESIRQKPEDLYREYLENHKKDEDIDLLKKFMEENRNKLEEWGIPEILK